MEQMMLFEQEGTVKDYCDSFLLLFDQVRNSEEMTDFYAIYLFICGLEPRIRNIFVKWHQYSYLKVEDVVSLALKIDTNNLHDSFSPFDSKSSFYIEGLEFDTKITLDELMKDNEFFRNGKIQETMVNEVTDDKKLEIKIEHVVDVRDSACVKDVKDSLDAKNDVICGSTMDIQKELEKELFDYFKNGHEYDGLNQGIARSIDTTVDNRNEPENQHILGIGSVLVGVFDGEKVSLFCDEIQEFIDQESFDAMGFKKDGKDKKNNQVYTEFCSDVQEKEFTPNWPETHGVNRGANECYECYSKLIDTGWNNKKPENSFPMTIFLDVNMIVKLRVCYQEMIEKAPLLVKSLGSDHQMKVGEHVRVLGLAKVLASRKKKLLMWLDTGWMQKRVQICGIVDATDYFNAPLFVTHTLVTRWKKERKKKWDKKTRASLRDRDRAKMKLKFLEAQLRKLNFIIELKEKNTYILITGSVQNRMIVWVWDPGSIILIMQTSFICGLLRAKVFEGERLCTGGGSELWSIYHRRFICSCSLDPLLFSGELLFSWYSRLEWGIQLLTHQFTLLMCGTQFDCMHSLYNPSCTPYCITFGGYCCGLHCWNKAHAFVFDTCD
ncbi:hypothetical protein Hdeb2414_s0025g00664531 [Helianthus debilis subsp. tardiflorus]